MRLAAFGAAIHVRWPTCAACATVTLAGSFGRQRCRKPLLSRSRPRLPLCSQGAHLLGPRPLNGGIAADEQ
jgi:hypothetical protein